MKQKLLSFLKEHDEQTFTVEEIAKSLKIEQSKEFVELIKIIAKLEEKQKIQLTDQGQIKLFKKAPLLEGEYRANDRGFGFVTVENLDNDIFIPKDAVHGALNGDRVLVDITKPANVLKEQLAEGEIVQIVERNSEIIIGIVEKLCTDKYYARAIATDKKLNSYPIWLVSSGLQPEISEVCQIEIIQYPSDKHKDIVGVVTHILGHKDDPGVDILTVVESYGIQTEFPVEVQEEADQVAERPIVPANDRKDLRNHTIVTIDGESAKDLDDAVEVQKLTNGHYKLGVHIADVSYYVTENSALDQEAFNRGTSVYLTDRVIPMLPRKLSNGICSLNPRTDRYALTCDMEIDAEGKVVEYKIYPSLINSNARLTYTIVNKILNNQATSEELAEFDELIPMLQNMKELHFILSKMRTNRGAISFDDQEAVIKVDAEGKPYDIELRVRDVAEKMIESFMLIANETVAKYFAEKELPFIYRIHEAPNSDKIQAFLETANTLGLEIHGTKDSMDSKELQAILDEVQGQPEEEMVNTMLLRSMQQAKYSVDSLGHYGLAAQYYTHFTSPIRRYPDLIVHRLIRLWHAQKLNKKKQQNLAKNLPKIAEQSSKMERRAIDAERETDAMKKAEYMEQHIGETYQGVITSVTKFGIFISLPNTIEGLVHLSQLKDDYYHYDEKHMMLIGKRFGRIFRLGEEVTIKVTKASAELREIDFDLILPDNEANTQASAEEYNHQKKHKSRKDKKKRRKKSKQGQSKSKKPFYKDITRKKNKRKRK